MTMTQWLKNRHIHSPTAFFKTQKRLMFLLFRQGAISFLTTPAPDISKKKSHKQQLPETITRIQMNCPFLPGLRVLYI